MAQLEMEERLTALEREMARLRSKVEEMGTADRPWWEVIADSFAGDPAHKEAAKLGRAYRESLRPGKRAKGKH